MQRRTSAAALSPFVLAASKAQSWEEVLRAYSKCRGYLEGIYEPTTAELEHGLSRMTNAKSTSLFYYGVVKAPIAPATPDKRLVAAVMRQLKASGNIPGLQRVIQEDVNSATLDGAKAKLALASTAGLWESALETLLSHPRLASSASQRRTALVALCSKNQWRLALGVLHMQPKVDPSPMLVRPLVRCLARLRHYDAALRLVALPLAAGHPMSASLLSAVLPSLQETGQWQLALQAADELQLFAVTKVEARRNVSFYNDLVHCLYSANLYAAFTLDDVVQQIMDRMHPRDFGEAIPTDRRQQLRALVPTEVFRQFQHILMAMTVVYSKAVAVPRWYSRSITAITAVAVKHNSVIVVLDTNFLLHLVQRNLPLEHFYAHMKQQYPDLHDRSFATVVVPFTTVSEIHAYVWGPRHIIAVEVRKLLWQRVVDLLQLPHVYVLSIACEYPCTAYSIIPRLAYRTMPSNLAGTFDHDPDLRILSVCAALQCDCRSATATANLGGTPIPPGVALFSHLKYHVRRYCNTVKGCCVDRLLLCTLDRRMSRGATQMGLRVFPCLLP